jgi:hypothetical protein
MFLQALQTTLKDNSVTFIYFISLIFFYMGGGGCGRGKSIVFSKTVHTLFGGIQKRDRSFKNHKCKTKVAKIPQIDEVELPYRYHKVYRSILRPTVSVHDTSIGR